MPVLLFGPSQLDLNAVDDCRRGLETLQAIATGKAEGPQPENWGEFRYQGKLIVFVRMDIEEGMRELVKLWREAGPHRFGDGIPFDKVLVFNLGVGIVEVLETFDMLDSLGMKVVDIGERVAEDPATGTQALGSLERLIKHGPLAHA